MKNFLDLVKAARSCRRFDETKPLTQADLNWLIECASFAPSARNAQELRFMTVLAGPVLNRLFPLTRWAGALKDWNGPQAGERPTAFIAVLMPEHDGDLLCYDTGIACQTMQLAATTRDIGACMIQSFDRHATAKLLQVPDGYKIALLMGFGIAKEIRILEPMPENGSFAYWRDANSAHHVPKRAVAELLVAEFK